MTTKRIARTRKTLPQHTRQLFMVGSGANTSYTQQEIRNLWKECGKQFLQHLDGLHRECSRFREKPMIFSILNLDEFKERERLL